MSETIKQRTGLRTTEFWLSVIALAAVTISESPMLSHGSTVKEVARIVAIVLCALGYTASRTIMKVKEIEHEEERQEGDDKGEGESH